MHLLGPDRRRENLAAEVLVVGLREEVDEAVAIEEINAHARHQRATECRNPLSFDPRRVGPHHVELGRPLRLFEEALDPALAVDPHDPKRRRRRLVHRDPRDRDIGVAGHVRGEHVGVVHPVELVAREDQHVPNVGLLDVAEVLPNRVGRALVPAGVVGRLLGREDFHESAVERIKRVRPADVAVEAHGVELRKHVNALHAAVDAIGERHVDDAVLARQRDCRFGAVAGQRKEPRAAASAENQSQYTLHAHVDHFLANACACPPSTMLREPAKPANWRRFRPEYAILRAIHGPDGTCRGRSRLAWPCSAARVSGLIAVRPVRMSRPLCLANAEAASGGSLVIALRTSSPGNSPSAAAASVESDGRPFSTSVPVRFASDVATVGSSDTRPLRTSTPLCFDRASAVSGDSERRLSSRSTDGARSARRWMAVRSRPRAWARSFSTRQRANCGLAKHKPVGGFGYADLRLNGLKSISAEAAEALATCLPRLARVIPQWYYEGKSPLPCREKYDSWSPISSVSASSIKAGREATAISSMLKASHGSRFPVATGAMPSPIRKRKCVMPSKKPGTTRSPRQSPKPGQIDAAPASGQRSVRPTAVRPPTKRGGAAGRSSPPDHGFVKIVEWSPEDGCYVGSAPPLVGRCCHGDEEADVFRQLCAVVEDWLEIYRREGRPLPTSLVGRRFSGKFQLRLGSDLHRLLALRAASANRSINDLAVEAIEKTLSSG